MNSIESSGHYETRCRTRQRQELLRAIEKVDLKNGRELILKNGIALGGVEPRLLSRFLYHAVKSGDSILVDELLTHKPDLTTPAGHADSMLWVAVKHGDLAIARSLVSAGADLRETLLSDPAKPSFLHAVIMWWQKHLDTEMAVHMIEHGADVNARDAKGNSVLHAAMLYDADLALVEKLLERGADVHAVNDEGYDLLLTAACNPSADVVLPILVGYKVADVVTKKRRAMRALHYLIVTGDSQKLPAMEQLLKMDLPVNEMDDGGLALLHWAVSIGGVEAVKILLDFGADPNIKAKGGTIPLLEAAKLPKSGIARLLIERGADTRLCHDDGRHPIHEACAEASLQNIHLLLQLGGDLNAADKEGCTPFHYLPLRNANLASIKLVLKHLALLHAKGVKIHEGNLAIIENNGSVKRFYEACSSELLKMKRTKVCNDIPFFCFFSKSADELSKLIRNEEFVGNYASRHESLFPLYVMQMKYAFTIAERTKDIMEWNASTVNEIFNGCASHLIVEKTAGYLCYDQLRDLQRKFYFLLHEKIDWEASGCGIDMLR